MTPLLRPSVGKSVGRSVIRGAGGTSQVSGDFSVALRGGLCFVFNFELGQ